MHSKNKFFLSVVLSLIMIAGMCLMTSCGNGEAGTGNGSVNGTDNGSESKDSTGQIINAADGNATVSVSGTMPLLEINTKNGENLDFVTSPVASLVSSQIAGWTPDYVMPPAPYSVDCSITFTDADGKKTLKDSEAAVKVRGNWTTNYDKKPLKLSFTKKVNLLGLNEGEKFKNWLLLAEYKDGSMLRNKAALSIAGEILAEDGLYAADAEFVQVKINGEYWGVYLLTELQQVNENRINITKAKDGYQGTDIGYLMEMDGYFSYEEPLQQFHVSYAGNADLIPFDGNGGSGETIKCLPEDESDPKKDIGITIKSDIYSQEQHDFIANYVENVYRIMYEAAYNKKAYCFNEDYSTIVEDNSLTPQEAVERVVDVNSLVDSYIICELTCDADIYWSSFYMSVDFGPTGNKKLTFQAPWDFDSAMGNKSRCINGTGFYAANIVPDVDGDKYHTINPWLAVLAYEDYFQDIVKTKWTKAYDDKVFEKALKMIDEDTEKYKEEFEENYKKWNNLRVKDAFINELSSKAKLCVTHPDAAAFLKEWLSARVDFLNGQWHR